MNTQTPEEKMKNDFVKVIVIFMLANIIIMCLLPINDLWLIVGVIQIVVSVAFQLFWNQYFKDKNV